MVINVLAAWCIESSSNLYALLPPIQSPLIHSTNVKGNKQDLPFFVSGPYDLNPGLYKLEPQPDLNPYPQKRQQETLVTPVVVPQNKPPPTHQPLKRPPKLPVFTSLSKEDQLAARWAWQYLQRNWQPKTGLINSVENYRWTTWWDQGSAIMGIHAAYQLKLISLDEFDLKISKLLKTLQTLPIPATGLPNKAYSTDLAQMRTLDNRPDPQGTQGWSALDMARFLLSLHTLRTYYPKYSQQINAIARQWQLAKLSQSGWLQVGVILENGSVRLLQEGRLGYEQYAAHSLLLWGIDAAKARNNPPTKTVKVENIAIQVDRRNLRNSNASNFLTNDPYILWGLELGWPPKAQAQKILAAQRNRFQRTNILTAVNEDSIDRAPHFLYSSIYADGQAWSVLSSNGETFPELRQLSTKAAFGWEALLPQDPYATSLRQKVQYLADKKKGYFAGRYENERLGVNSLLNVNTNAVILESVLYRARQQRPISDSSASTFSGR